MICVITIIRYPKYFAFFGILSMALFHIPLLLNRQIKFYKLMGSGKNRGFSLQPNWQQWGILYTIDSSNYNKSVSIFIDKYLHFFKCKTISYYLQPISCKGTWSGKSLFENLSNDKIVEGKIAVLTRATIKINKLKSFWQHVPLVNEAIEQAKGLQVSYGIGEVPFIKQATFSIWNTVEDMKQFAYAMQTHKTVVEKTRSENWYSEELFARFVVLHTKEKL